MLIVLTIFSLVSGLMQWWFVPSVFINETLFLVFLAVESTWFEIKWLEHYFDLST